VVQRHGRCGLRHAPRGARVVVPLTRTASVSGGKPRSADRDKTIQRVARVGRRRWKKESGYHRQGTVENALFRYKSTLATGFTLLVLGRPRSVAIVP
ncbi:MAG: hypothetical protein ACJAQ3_003913, partial [Planctomycetota bacterium]